MSTNAEKLRNYRNNLNLTQEELSKVLNVSFKSLKDAEDGIIPVSKDIIFALQNTFAAEFGMPDFTEDTTSKMISIPYYRPFITKKTEDGLSFDYPNKESMYFDRKYIQEVLKVNTENSSIVIAKGNAMDSGNGLPSDIKDGDYLFIDNSLKHIENGKIFVMETDKNYPIIRKVSVQEDCILLKSANSAYKDIKVSSVQDIVVIGKVVFNISGILI